MKKTAIYPGSFDPITKGHLDVLNKASKIFDRVIIAVLKNDAKKGLLPTEDRVSLIKDALKEMKLDNMLREVYMNRYRLGREYYNVQDYNRTFDHMLEMMERKRINEDTATMGDMEYLDNQYSVLSSVINECSCDLRLPPPVRRGRFFRPCTQNAAASKAGRRVFPIYL